MESTNTKESPSNLADAERLNHLIQSVTCKYPQELDVSLEGGCQQLLLSYLDEISHAAIEQAALLAKHRGSTTVEEEDIRLVLEKAMNVSVPGASARAPSLHKDSFHALSLKHEDENTGSNGLKPTDDNKSKRGTKRKA